MKGRYIKKIMNEPVNVSLKTSDGEVLHIPLQKLQSCKFFDDYEPDGTLVNVPFTKENVEQFLDFLDGTKQTIEDLVKLDRIMNWMCCDNRRYINEIYAAVKREIETIKCGDDQMGVPLEKMQILADEWDIPY